MPARFLIPYLYAIVLNIYEICILLHKIVAFIFYFHMKYIYEKLASSVECG